MLCNELHVPYQNSTSFLPCINDFKMTFRSSADIGKTRQMSTPTSSVLLNNIENCVMKWQAAQHEDCKMLTDKVMGQINCSVCNM